MSEDKEALIQAAFWRRAAADFATRLRKCFQLEEINEEPCDDDWIRFAGKAVELLGMASMEASLWAGTKEADEALEDDFKAENADNRKGRAEIQVTKAQRAIDSFLSKVTDEEQGEAHCEDRRCLYLAMNVCRIKADNPDGKLGFDALKQAMTEDPWLASIVWGPNASWNQRTPVQEKI